MGSYYTEAYYERGLEAGLSCYQNYRWIPELTIPMAMTMIDFLKIERDHKVLDFGCAKGFLVKALRLLHRQAWGADTSSYALSQVPVEVKNYCSKRVPNTDFDVCIAKDVFEHLLAATLRKTLLSLRSERLFAVVPLGEDRMYRAPQNNCDRTHKICMPEDWWSDTFEICRWEVTDFRFRIDGIKDSYYERFPEAHGFFTCKR